MLILKLRFTLVTLLLFAAVATGTGYFVRSLASQDEPKRQPNAPRPQVAASPDDTTQRPAPGRMFVVGRVLDPQGKPVPNAMTMVYAAIKQPGSGGHLYEKMLPSAIGQARSDNSGRFQVDAQRTSSSRHHLVGVVALAPGHGAGWAEFDPDTDRPIADISLRTEHVIQGRLFDLNGRPVQGVTVSVTGMRPILPQNPNILFEGSEGPLFSWAHVNDFPAWPKPVVSDAEGRFTIHGAGRDLHIDLIINDPRFAQQRILVETDGASGSKPVTLALEPAKVIRGRVTEADTGKPIPHAHVVVMSYRGKGATHNDFEADAEGRFRTNPVSADRFEVSASAPDRQPYLTIFKLFNWPKGAVEYPIDLALPRGVLIRGKVIEEGSGKPVAGARVSFGARQTGDGQSRASNAVATSGLDGSIRIGVLPSPGCLVILGPSDDYVLREIGDAMVFQGKPGGRRFYVHGFLACDPKPAGAGLDVNIVLRPGMTVNGRVVGPDSQPIQDAWMISRMFLPVSPTAWLRWSGRYHGSVKSGQFEVHGLDPDAEVPVYFLDPHHQLGATANLSGKSPARGPVTIRLQPCGTAKARLVDASGKPLAGYRGSSLIAMVVTPGPYPVGQQENETRLTADVATLAGVDSINYADGPISDALGRIAFPALIPGATYRRNPRGTSGTQLSDEFRVKPGETLDLGDIVIEKPQP
jgi:protocatechuate 3,4-dioxygenase beta subunit